MFILNQNTCWDIPEVENGLDEASDRSYQHLAANFLSSFCSVDTFITAPDMFRTLPLLNEIIILFEK